MRNSHDLTKLNPSSVSQSSIIKSTTTLITNKNESQNVAGQSKASPLQMSRSNSSIGEKLNTNTNIVSIKSGSQSRASSLSNISIKNQNNALTSKNSNSGSELSKLIKITII
jgi:hypothetical protein